MKVNLATVRNTSGWTDILACRDKVHDPRGACSRPHPPQKRRSESLSIRILFGPSRTSLLRGAETELCHQSHTAKSLSYKGTKASRYLCVIDSGHKYTRPFHSTQVRKRRGSQTLWQLTASTRCQHKGFYTGTGPQVLLPVSSQASVSTHRRQPP